MKKIDFTCVNCGQPISFEVEEHDLNTWLSADRPKIQECFPYLSNGEREMFLSQICDRCWKDIFPNEDEIDLEDGEGMPFDNDDLPW
jgi:hypothetical protein